MAYLGPVPLQKTIEKVLDARAPPVLDEPLGVVACFAALTTTTPFDRRVEPLVTDALPAILVL